MSGWGDFDDGEEWDAAPAVVHKKKAKKKAEPMNSAEWDDVRAPTAQDDAAAPSGAPAPPAVPLQQQEEEPPDKLAGFTSGETVDLDTLQQKVSDLDAQLDVEEQDRLIREALLAATDNSTIFDLKEMHGNVRTCSVFSVCPAFPRCPSRWQGADLVVCCLAAPLACPATRW